jgi:hypothetical protein
VISKAAYLTAGFGVGAKAYRDHGCLTEPSRLLQAARDLPGFARERAPAGGSPQQGERQVNEMACVPQAIRHVPKRALLNYLAAA